MNCLHRPQYKVYLTDKGAGNPPLEFLVALEQGLREYASVDRAAFGSYVNFNFREYTLVELWRKREAYIGLVRYVFAKGIYSKYVNYNWADYTLRLASCKTFEVRHWPYTNGSKHLEGLVDPKHWTVNKDKSARKRSATSVPTFEAPEVVLAIPEKSEDSAESVEWDSEEGEFVPKTKK